VDAAARGHVMSRARTLNDVVDVLAAELACACMEMYKNKYKN
jgi:hypothetical protein